VNTSRKRRRCDADIRSAAAAAARRSVTIGGGGGGVIKMSAAAARRRRRTALMYCNSCIRYLIVAVFIAYCFCFVLICHVVFCKTANPHGRYHSKETMIEMN